MLDGFRLFLPNSQSPPTDRPRMRVTSADRFTLSSAKFLVMISADDGTFVLILLFIGFKVETDVVINANSVPVCI